jgi:hypothetical protein
MQCVESYPLKKNLRKKKSELIRLAFSWSEASTRFKGVSRRVNALRKPVFLVKQVSGEIAEFESCEKNLRKM